MLKATVKFGEILMGRYMSRIQNCLDIVHSFDGSNMNQFLPIFFQALEEVSIELNRHPNGNVLRQEFFASLTVMDESPLHQRMRCKPLGYPGDFLLLDWIYTRKAKAEGIGRQWDLLFHEYPGACAVRNRTEKFSLFYKNFKRQEESPISVLSLGCGSCRDVLDALHFNENREKESFSPKLEVLYCVDQEPKALEYAKKLFAENGAKHFAITWSMTSALRLNPQLKFDLIWSAGLFDYLNDRLARILIKKMWHWLKEGGCMIFGNFSPRNPSRVPMELCGQWFLIHRTEEELADLAISVGIPKNNVTIDTEQLGINLFCEIWK